MRLVSFSVEKYRSITKTQKLELRRLTTLIGPNNEGKSNLLNGIVTVLQLLPAIERLKLLGSRARPFLHRNRRIYDWERDFPVHLQARHPDGESAFNLEFELDADDLIAFREEVKSNLNGTLPIRVTAGRTKSSVKVAKQGRGGGALTAKSDAIARFVGKRFQFEYIPTVRTAALARTTVDGLVAAELGQVSELPEFRQTLRALQELQQPTLERMSAALTETVREFMPSIASVRVRVSEEYFSRTWSRSFEVIVDDGTPTALEQKGDGVQSLVTLGSLGFQTCSS